jgi:pSer/pThr/pTyr-binding forkhead associated (FHA) protein
MTLKLLVEHLSRRQPGKPIELTIHDSIAIIGREGCDLTIRDERVSRQHAAFVIVKGELMLRDLNSTNGLFLNDRRVIEAPLAAGSRIRLGSYNVTLLAVDDESGTAGTPPGSQTVIGRAEGGAVTYVEDMPTSSDAREAPEALDQVKQDVLHGWPDAFHCMSKKKQEDFCSYTSDKLPRPKK